MSRDFAQVTWDARLEDDCRQLMRLAIREDLDRGLDWTTVALIGQETATANMAVREPGRIAGMKVVPLVIDEGDAELAWTPAVEDGVSVSAGTRLGTVTGSARDLLTLERIMLNLVGRLSGIATLTARYVDAVQGTSARVYDTRKTTPGWRRLEKYAVQCGGGSNHRCGLYDAVLIKDNHLAIAASQVQSHRLTDAIERVRQFLAEQHAMARPNLPCEADSMILEIEVDALEQLEAVLPAKPDIVLLDNMSIEQLRAATALRGEKSPETQLEASGGVTLATIRDIAETGVERISVGSLTHGATSLDVGLDYGG